MRQLLSRVVPSALPQPEPDALAGAVLAPSPAHRAAARMPQAWWLLAAVIALTGLIAASLAGAATIALVAFVLSAVTDWAAGRTAAGAQLLRLAGWGEPLRSLLRWVLLLSVLDRPSAVVMPLALQGCALAFAAATWWLQTRQPPLEFRPGARVQPPRTVAYAAVYRRSAGWPGALLVAEITGAVVAVVAPWPVLLVAVALAVVGYAGYGLWWAVRLAAQSSGATTEVERRLDELGVTCAVYVSGGIGQSRYLFNPWVAAFDALDAPPVVIVREANQLAALATVDAAPVVYCPASRHVESACRPAVRVAFYLANGHKNGDLLRNPRLTHVFLGHGDSDKATSASPIARVYDQLWVAGPAAIDRYREAGIAIAEDAFVVVGRPQTDELPVGRTDHERPVVLYAPTFEGYAEATNYSSVLQLGGPVVERLLARQPAVTVWFRPHPSTGIQRGDTRAARQRINALVRAAGQPHRVLDDHPGEGVLESLRGADLLITDVSSVSSDFLHTERPVIVTDPGGLGRDEFLARFPSQRAAYLLGPDLAGFDELVDLALGPDPLLPERRALKRHVLGDLPDGAVHAFVVATRRLTGST